MPSESPTQRAEAMLKELAELHAKARAEVGDQLVACCNGTIGGGHIHQEQDEETGHVYPTACQFVAAGSDIPPMRDAIAALHNNATTLLALAREALAWRAFDDAVGKIKVEPRAPHIQALFTKDMLALKHDVRNARAAADAALAGDSQ